MGIAGNSSTTCIWGSFDLVVFKVMFRLLFALAVFPTLRFSKSYFFYSYDAFSTKVVAVCEKVISWNLEI